MDVDSDVLTAGQSMTLAVRVDGASPTAVPQVAVPDGLRLDYGGQSSQSGWTIDFAGKRHSQRTVTYQYRLTALVPGSYTVGPADVEVGTTQMQAPAVTITVNPVPPQGQARIRAFAGFPVDHVVEGQVVVYEYRLESRDQVVRSQWALPSMDGLVPPRDGDHPRQVYTLDGPDGAVRIDRTYVPLVATGPGKHDYPGGVVQVDLATGDKAPPPSAFDPFGMMGSMIRTRSDAVATGPSTLTIDKLPPAPPGFTGLVGDFDISAVRQDPTSPVRVPVGKSVQWDIRVVGDGSLEGFTLPHPPETAGIRVYDGSPLADAKVNDATGVYDAAGSWPRIIVPTKVGHYALPAMDLVTFSPTKHAYETHHVELGEIDVIPGERTASDLASFREDQPPPQAVAPEDIRDIEPSGFARMPDVGWALPVGLGAAGLPGIGVAMREMWVMIARRRRERAVERKVKPSERLRHLPADRTDRLAALDGALRAALAWRGGIDVDGLDRDAATAALPDALRDATRAATKALDRARFAGNAEAGQIEEQIVDLVRKIEA